MKTMKLGIASYDEFKAHTMAIAAAKTYARQALAPETLRAYAYQKHSSLRRAG